MSTALAIRTADDIVPAFTRDDIAGRLTPLLGTGDTLARIAQVVQLECMRNADLLKCDPFSIIDATARILSWHLEPGETAYLVPFGPKCTPMKGYKGMIQMMYDSGHVRSVVAHVVYMWDQFSHSYGLTPTLEHVPATYKKRGDPIGAYCIVKMKSGEPVFRYMEYEEIDEIRQAHSKQWKKGRVPPWYMVKTVIRQTSKHLPQDSRFAELVARFQEEEQEEIELLADVPEAEALPEQTEPPRQPWPGQSTATVTPTQVLIIDPELEQALQMVIPGSPDRWGGNGGKRLGEITSGNLLRGVASWCVGKEKYADLLKSVGIVLQWREEVGFPEREPEDEFPEPEEEPQLFAPGTAAERRSRNAIAEGR